MLAWLAAAALAEPYRTDHHHADVHWVTVQTRYLRIHVPARGEPGEAVRSALAAAAVGDDLLLRLGAVSGWIPRAPVHVVLTDEADAITAFTVPSWGLVALSADPGAVTLRLRGRQDWIPDALAHELGHLAAHRVAGALPPTASYGLQLVAVGEGGGLGVAGAAVAAPNAPYGWSEGLAESWSEAVGVNRWSAGRAALLRTSALDDRLLDFDEWWVAADKGDVLDAERAYQQGYAFARWLQQETGEDVLGAVARRAGQRYPLDWARLLAGETGEPARISWARWRAAAYGEALEQAARIRAAGETDGIELEDWVGGWVAAEADLDARDRWEARPPRAREEAREATGAFDLYPQASADGRWVGVAQGGWVHVWRGTPTAPVTPRAELWVPSLVGASFGFVPGRDAVVAVVERDAVRGRLGRGTARDTVGQLAVVDLTPSARLVRHRGERVPVDALTGLRRRVHFVPGTERGRDPACSPDGRRVAWLRPHDGTTELVVSDLDGSHAAALSSFDDGTWLQHPSWSPDGASIVVSALRTDRPDLWRVDVASGRWTPLTGDPQDEPRPRLGRRRDLVRLRSGDVFDVFRLDPATGRVDRMTRDVGGAVTPFPLPGGDLLYAAYTAFGLKAERLPASERLAEPSAAFGPPARRGGRPGPSPSARRPPTWPCACTVRRAACSCPRWGPSCGSRGPRTGRTPWAARFVRSATPWSASS
ncbi:MAG: hypothetical protein R3F59_11870 [Myxococcota bacterium]